MTHNNYESYFNSSSQVKETDMLDVYVNICQHIFTYVFSTKFAQYKMYVNAYLHNYMYKYVTLCICLKIV